MRRVVISASRRGSVPSRTAVDGQKNDSRIRQVGSLCTAAMGWKRKKLRFGEANLPLVEIVEVKRLAPSGVS